MLTSHPTSSPLVPFTHVPNPIPTPGHPAGLTYPDSSAAMNWNPTRGPDSPYQTGPSFGVGVPYHGFPTPGHNNQAVLSPPTLRSWHNSHMSPHQNWPAMSYTGPAGHPSSGSLGYNPGMALAVEQPYGNTQEAIDPRLRLQNTKPAPKVAVPEATTSSQVPWNEGLQYAVRTSPSALP